MKLSKREEAKVGLEKDTVPCCLRDFTLKHPIFNSKAKAKSFDLLAEQDQKRPRPNTSTVMARRMLSRALNNPNIKADPKEETMLKAESEKKSIAKQNLK